MEKVPVSRSRHKRSKDCLEAGRFPPTHFARSGHSTGVSLRLCKPLHYHRMACHERAWAQGRASRMEAAGIEAGSPSAWRQAGSGFVIGSAFLIRNSSLGSRADRHRPRQESSTVSAERHRHFERLGWIDPRRIFIVHPGRALGGMGPASCLCGGRRVSCRLFRRFAWRRRCRWWCRRGSHRSLPRTRPRRPCP